MVAPSPTILSGGASSSSASPTGAAIEGDWYVRDYDGPGSLAAATRSGCKLSIWQSLRARFGATSRQRALERHAVVLDARRGALVSEAWACETASQSDSSSRSGQPSARDAAAAFEGEQGHSSLLGTLPLRDVLGAAPMPPAGPGEPLHTQGRARLAIHTFVKDRKEPSKLVPRTLLFTPAYDQDADGDDPPLLPGEAVAGEHQVSTWHAALEKALRANKERPRSLIVLVNPVGGKGL